MDTNRRNTLLLDYVKAIALATVAGLLYNRYKDGSQTSTVVVCLFAFAAATVATGYRVLLARYFGRR